MSLARNQFLTLNFIAALPREAPGIDIADGIHGVGRSSVYAALAALQRDGYIEARWDHAASHPRRMVRINGAGRDALRAEQQLRGLQPLTAAPPQAATQPRAATQEAAS